MLLSDVLAINQSINQSIIHHMLSLSWHAVLHSAFMHGSKADQPAYWLLPGLSEVMKYVTSLGQKRIQSREHQ